MQRWKKNTGSFLMSNCQLACPKNGASGKKEGKSTVWKCSVGEHHNSVTEHSFTMRRGPNFTGERWCERLEPVEIPAASHSHTRPGGRMASFSKRHLCMFIDWRIVLTTHIAKVAINIPYYNSYFAVVQNIKLFGSCCTMPLLSSHIKEKCNNF